VCDGTSRTCPADAFAPTTTLCRAANEGCDVSEYCPGNGPSCPGDVRLEAGHVCRPSTGACDLAEVCDGLGASCPSDQVADAGIVCRASTGTCDPAEVCGGVSGLCPADALEPSNSAACTPYRCTGSAPACTVSCTMNSDCASDRRSVCRGGQCVRARLAFITHNRVPPTFGNVAGGNALCQAVASDAGFGGTFRAWLSSVDGGSPSASFQRDGGPWVRLSDKALIAVDWNDLTAGPPYPVSSIAFDELGQVPVPGDRTVWTGTSKAGVSAGTNTDCNGWTQQTSTLNAMTGECDYNTAQWTEFLPQLCAATFRLYCFEQ